MKSPIPNFMVAVLAGLIALSPMAAITATTGEGIELRQNNVSGANAADILVALATHDPHLPIIDMEVYDRFFKPEIYDQYSRDEISREDFAKMALERMVEQAAALGIAENEITQAMFAGKFNPHMDDLRLAYEGLPMPVGVENTLYNQGTVAYHRNQEWGERFGGLTGKQLYKMGQRLRVFERGPEHAYANVKTGPGVQAVLADLRDTNNSAFAYFRLGTARAEDPFNLTEEYGKRRKEDYLPMLKKRLYGKHSTIVSKSESATVSNTPAQRMPRNTGAHRVIGITVEDYILGGAHNGAVIRNISNNAPAAQFLEIGDILLFIEDKEIWQASDATNAVKDLAHAQESLLMGISRDGKRVMHSVPLANSAHVGDELALSGSADNCREGLIKDAAGNKVVYTPLAYAIAQSRDGSHLLQTSLKAVAAHDRLGTFNTITKPGWCYRNTFLMVPVRLMSQHWDKTLQQFERIIRAFNSSNEISSTYIIHNNNTKEPGEFAYFRSSILQEGSKLQYYLVASEPETIDDTPPIDIVTADRNVSPIYTRESSDTNAFTAFVLHALNSLLLDFGDELLCGVFYSDTYRSCFNDKNDSLVALAQEDHKAALAGSLLGYMFSPLALFLTMANRRPPRENLIAWYTKIDGFEGLVAAFAGYYAPVAIEMPESVIYPILFGVAIGFSKGIFFYTVMGVRHAMSWIQRLIRNVISAFLYLAAIVLFLSLFANSSSANGGAAAAGALRKHFDDVAIRQADDAMARDAARVQQAQREAAERQQREALERQQQRQTQEMADRQRQQQLREVQERRLAKQAEELQQKRQAQIAETRERARLEMQKEMQVRKAVQSKPPVQPKDSGRNLIQRDALKKQVDSLSPGKVKDEAHTAIRKLDERASAERVREQNAIAKQKQQSLAEIANRQFQQKKLIQKKDADQKFLADKAARDKKAIEKAKAARGPSKSAQEMANDLAGQIGRNSVTLKTPNKIGHIDLRGKSHFDKRSQTPVSTPHVQTRDIKTGADGHINYPKKTETVRPATKQDIRTARELARRKGLLQ